MKFNLKYLLLSAFLSMNISCAGNESFFVEIPTVFGVSVCNEWLDIEPVAKLHMAFNHSTDKENRVDLNGDEGYCNDRNRNARTLFDDAKKAYKTLHIINSINDAKLKAILKISTVKHLSLSVDVCYANTGTVLTCVDGITYTGFAELITHCKDLVTLNLKNYSLLTTDAAMIALAKHSRHLKKVNLNGCVKLTDVGIIALAEGSPNLEIVDISNSDTYTDAAMIALGKHCPLLKIINLLTPISGGNEQLTDATMIALAEGCPSLEMVILTGWEKLTAAGISILAEHCGRLKKVILTGCDQFTEADIDVFAGKLKMRRAFPLSRRLVKR